MSSIYPEAHLVRTLQGALDYLDQVAPRVTVLHVPDDLDRSDYEAVSDVLNAIPAHRLPGHESCAVKVAVAMCDVFARVELGHIAWHDPVAVSILVRAMSDNKLRVVPA